MVAGREIGFNERAELMATTHLHGYKIAYNTTGQGNAVVLLHGFCESSHIWNSFVAELSQQYTVVTIDLPGFGASDMIESYTISALADAVVQVLDVLELKTCVLIGHSMGGYVAVDFAQRYSVRLKGLGFFHSHPFADNEEKKKNRLKAIEFIQKHGVTPFVTHLFTNLFAPQFVIENPAVVEDFIDECTTQHRDAVIAASRAMMEREDKSAVLKHLRCPVLFIIGEQDTSIPLQQSFSQVALALQSEVHLLQGIGHLGMLEAKEQSLDIVRGFLAWAYAQR